MKDVCKRPKHWLIFNYKRSIILLISDNVGINESSAIVCILFGPFSPSKRKYEFCKFKFANVLSRTYFCGLVGSKRMRRVPAPKLPIRNV